MSFLTNQLNQTITLWVDGGIDSLGDPTHGTPTTISGRWEQRAEVFTGVDGAEHVSQSIVYLAQDVELGNWLFLGTSTEVDPSNLIGAYKVQQFFKIPNLAADDFERRAML